MGVGGGMPHLCRIRLWGGHLWGGHSLGGGASLSYSPVGGHWGASELCCLCCCCLCCCCLCSPMVCVVTLKNPVLRATGPPPVFGQQLDCATAHCRHLRQQQLQPCGRGGGWGQGQLLLLPPPTQLPPPLRPPPARQLPPQRGILGAAHGRGWGWGWGRGWSVEGGPRLRAAGRGGGRVFVPSAAWDPCLCGVWARLTPGRSRGALGFRVPLGVRVWGPGWHLGAWSRGWHMGDAYTRCTRAVGAVGLWDRGLGFTV